MVEVFDYYQLHWRAFIKIAIVCIVLSVVSYALYHPYVAVSRVMINDSQNSSSQAVSSGISGVSKSLILGKKGNSITNKQVERLKSQSFTDYAAKSLGITSRELSSSLQFVIEGEFIIKVQVQSDKPETAASLSAKLTELAVNWIRFEEKKEMEDLSSDIEQEQKHALDRYLELKRKLSQYNGVTDLDLSPSGAGKISDYLAELRIRANELSLEIKENDRLVEYLTEKTKGGASGPYGVGQKIGKLEQENQLLKLRYKSTQSSIKSLSFPIDLLLDLKKKSETEFATYQELSQALAKVDIQKISQKSRFEILEMARVETTKPKIGFWLILGTLLILGQMIFSLFLYFKFLLHQERAVGRGMRELHEASLAAVGNGAAAAAVASMAGAYFEFDRNKTRNSTSPLSFNKDSTLSNQNSFKFETAPDLTNQLPLK